MAPVACLSEKVPWAHPYEEYEHQVCLMLPLVALTLLPPSHTDVCVTVCGVMVQS
jgi:hypothetical protein